jgi:hypothetical protein
MAIPNFEAVIAAFVLLPSEGLNLSRLLGFKTAP